MMPLIILLSAFIILLLAVRVVSGKWNLLPAGNGAMSVMLFFTAIGHFAFTQGMAMMVPDPVPLKREIIYLTGIAEILAGAALFFPKYRHDAALFLILFFVLLLPANIYAAIHHIDYQKASFDGKGPEYLWFRIPLQLLFIAWVWFFGIRKKFNEA